MTMIAESSQESGSLKGRIVEVASTLFATEGYSAVTMRRVAQAAGCSQMAMYRHFANKEALIQHLCQELYMVFATRINQRMEKASNPWHKLERFVEADIRFAVRYPDHYSLVFLMRHSDPTVLADRERLGQQFLTGVRQAVRGTQPEGMDDEIVEMRLRQVLSCIHGAAALLIAHPRVYGLTQSRAIADTQNSVRSLLAIPEALAQLESRERRS